MAQVFISYSRREILFVKKLAKDLEEQGYDVWFDLTDIAGGDHWADEIQKGIEESEDFIIVVSSNSIESEWVEKEFLFANNQGLKIIPILFDDCEAKLPIWLMDIQYIDMRNKFNYRKNLAKIIAVLSSKTTPLAPPKKTDIVAILKEPRNLWIGGGLLLALILLAVFALKPAPTTPVEPTKEATTIPTEIISTETKAPSPTPSETPRPSNTETPITPTLTQEATVVPSATSIPTEIVDAHGAEMVLIPSGNFMMGSDRGQSDEKPAHMVQLGSFYIDKYEVSNAQYRDCFNDLACDRPSNTTFFFNERYRDHPVVFVDWDAAVNFCNWREARLPTEAEWEKAARGTTWYTYPWGNTFYGEFLNFCDVNCGNDWAHLGFNDHYLSTAPVGSFEAGKSSYEVYDMAGNVTEWVADWYSSNYYRSSPILNPPGAESGVHHVLRGGSWYSDQEGVQTFAREHLSPNSAFNYIGFRCAVDLNIEE